VEDDDNSDTDQRPLDSNDGESGTSGANPVGPDSTDEQRLGKLLGLFFNLVYFYLLFIYFS
jgi:hypothetical protein